MRQIPRTILCGQSNGLSITGTNTMHVIYPYGEEGTIGDVTNSKRPLLIIPKVQLHLRVTRRIATALARYPQKLAKIVCG